MHHDPYRYYDEDRAMLAELMERAKNGEHLCGIPGSSPCTQECFADIACNLCKKIGYARHEFDTFCRDCSYECTSCHDRNPKNHTPDAKGRCPYCSTGPCSVCGDDDSFSHMSGECKNHGEWRYHEECGTSFPLEPDITVFDESDPDVGLSGYTIICPACDEELSDA